MSIAIHESAFALNEHSFTVSGGETDQQLFYIEYSTLPDFTDPHGSPDNAVASTFITTSGIYIYNHLVLIDPLIANGGDIIYWRVRQWNGTEFTARTTHKLQMKRSRNEETDWNFIVGGSPSDTSTVGLQDNCKKYFIPSAMSLSPDFLCIPGDLIAGQNRVQLSDSLTDYSTIREDFYSTGVNIPFYASPGNADLESNSFNKQARLYTIPSAGVAIGNNLVIRGPYIDPAQNDTNNLGSYYAFGYGNALFIFFNDWLGGTIFSDPNTAAYESQVQYIESVFKEHRHKYKWCFMFSHTSVDETDPDSSSANTIAGHNSGRNWMMNLHETYKVTAHFSGQYYGWRVNRHSNNTIYINATFGGGTTSTTNNSWHNDLAFAHVKIGTDENGNTNSAKCCIDIIDAGIGQNASGTILNTSTEENGTIVYQQTTVSDHNNNLQSIFSSDKKFVPISFGSRWYYSAYSSTLNPIDFVLTKRFMETEFQKLIFNSGLDEDDQQISWKSGSAPFYNGTIKTDLYTTGGYFNGSISNGTYTSKNYLQLPFYFQNGTLLENTDSYAPTPAYFLSTFNVPYDLSVNEIQLLYEIEDAAYIWINGQLAWYSDGEGVPSILSHFTSRPRLDPNKINPESEDFANDLITDLEPLPNQQDIITHGGLVENDCRRRLTEINYETAGQPIRITDIDIIQSLKNTNNIIAVCVLQGRDTGKSSQQSNDMAFDLELALLGKTKNTLFAPQVDGPSSGEQFNLGRVVLSWQINEPPTKQTSNTYFDLEEDTDPYISSEALVNTDFITYEIEYTLNYVGASTIWHTLKRRIPYTDTEYEWIVGKMIKSDSVRYRIRAYDTENEIASDWSISEEFSINVFDLIAPAIVSPVSLKIYSDFILIILDESQTKNTFNQKIRYTLEYSSKKRSIDWTIIRKDLPFGQNIIRWDISELLSSDDYVLRLTAKNKSTCFKTTESDPDQIAKRFIYNIKIQQSGLFLIDTTPPKAVIKIDTTQSVTNELNQIINIYADDETTQVESLQIRECPADTDIMLGDLENPYNPDDICKNVTELLKTNTDVSTLFGKNAPYSPKIYWQFKDISGLRKIESILMDTAGNSSLQETIRVFLSLFDNSTDTINDFIIVIEQRDKISISTDTSVPGIIVEPSVFEVIYLVTNLGFIYVLEPFPRLLYQVQDVSIKKLHQFNETIYFLAYSSNKDIGYFYRHDNTTYTKLQEFTDNLSVPTAVVTYNKIMYFGFANGQLWSFNGTTFTQIRTFTDPINTLSADYSYLYIGFQNSTTISVFNGTSFVTGDLD